MLIEINVDREATRILIERRLGHTSEGRLLNENVCMQKFNPHKLVPALTTGKLTIARVLTPILPIASVALAAKE